MVARSNVVSISGSPYVLPCYADRRGRQVSFAADMTDGTRAKVVGERTVFNMVLHRMLGEGGSTLEQSKWALLWNRWCISEPESGMLVAKGGTRQGALDALAERVAYEGGEEAFESAVRVAVHAGLQKLQQSAEK